jgi:hypothetical protein
MPAPIGSNCQARVTLVQLERSKARPIELERTARNRSLADRQVPIVEKQPLLGHQLDAGSIYTARPSEQVRVKAEAKGRHL